MGTPFPAEIALAALVFALGLRHGLDPDHLVAIDGLARSSRSRWTGFFFSLGHGIVVTLVGVALALAATDSQPPAWVEGFGTAISIAVLVALGAANLVMSVRTPRGTRVPTVAFRGRWLAERLGGANHPVVVAAIGAAFAVSFDTLSHAILFSASGATAAGWAVAAALGLVFTAGMALVDTLNGWWVGRLMGSRVMSVTVALLCFAIAGATAAKLAWPAVDESFEALAPYIGAATLAILLAAAWLGRHVRIAFRV
jgi:high-affinity nickel-transport protein